MDKKDMVILQGIGLTLEMLLSLMPSSQCEHWIEKVNEYNQVVSDTVGDSFKVKVPPDKKG